MQSRIVLIKLLFYDNNANEGKKYIITFAHGMYYSHDRINSHDRMRRT